MEAFALYLLKSVIWLTGFALVYFIFLRNERFFRLKRFFLIAGILIAFILPALNVHYQVELQVPVEDSGSFVPDNSSQVSSFATVTREKSFDYKDLLLFLYLSGILFFTLKLLKNIASLVRAINREKGSRIGSSRVIRTSGFKDSFSFFNYVFINPGLDETESEMIMHHELVHIGQRHWIDLLLAELLRLFQWINPAAWIYTGFIRQNHEYIADEVALQRAADKAVYKAVLVNQILDSRVLSLSNSFNYSLNKKRFEMMRKIVTSPYRKMKILLVIPVFALVLYAFATPEYLYISDQQAYGSDLPVPGQKKAGGVVVNEEGKPLPGVSVIVTNKLTGGITDIKGRFLITGIPDGSSLVFSMKGYKTYSMPPLTSSNQNLYVRLVKDTDSKEEIKVRTSDGSDLKALVVVDGVISETGMAKVNPDAILSMNVLKDESATDKYGDKGKDGVIEIITRGSQSGQVDQRSVRGTVLKENGSPLAETDVTATGALGNATYVTTGSDGKFRLDNVQQDALLLFSCRGYKKLSVKPDFANEMIVRLEKDPGYKEPVAASSAAQASQLPVAVDGVMSDKTISEVRKELGYNMGIAKPLLPKDAVEKYGEKGANGVWEITTRKKAIEMGLKPSFPRLSPDDYPTFQGQRFTSFINWVSKQARYPEEARSKQIQGWVQVNFTVNLDGTISNVAPVGTSDKILADEVIRTIKSSPVWEPPRNSAVDEPYTSSVTLKFQLPDEILIDAPFVVVEEMPMYPGGEKELLNFIATNVKYPAQAAANKIEGKVIIRFIVNTQGDVEGVSVLKGVDPSLDAEALRVVDLLTGFKPGMQGGKPVNVWYMVPVNFSLSEEKK